MLAWKPWAGWAIPQELRMEMLNSYPCGFGSPACWLSSVLVVLWVSFGFPVVPLTCFCESEVTPYMWDIWHILMAVLNVNNILNSIWYLQPTFLFLIAVSESVNLAKSSCAVIFPKQRLCVSLAIFDNLILKTLLLFGWIHRGLRSERRAAGPWPSSTGLRPIPLCVLFRVLF